MIRSFLFKAAAVATVSVGTLAATASAAAAQVMNFLPVGGQFSVRSPGTGSGFPVLIDFFSGGTAFPPTVPGFGTPGNVYSGTSTGIYSSIAPGTRGTIQDLTVTSSGISPTPLPAFMTIGGYTFTITSSNPASASSTNFGPISLTDSPSGALAFIGVKGTYTGPGTSMGTFDGTLSATFAGSTAAQVFAAVNSGGTETTTFQATFTATPTSTVPEPSTYALLATGVAALGFAARRRRAQV